MKKKVESKFRIFILGFIIITVFFSFAFLGVINPGNNSVIYIGFIFLFLFIITSIIYYLSLYCLSRSKNQLLKKKEDESKISNRITSSLLGVLHALGDINILSLYNRIIVQNINKKEKLISLLKSESHLIDSFKEKIDSIKENFVDSYKNTEQKTDVLLLINNILSFIEAKHIEAKGITLKVKSTVTTLFVEINPAEIIIAIENIIENSYDALSVSDNKEKNVIISVDDQNSFANITISDNGKGINNLTGIVPHSYFEIGKSDKPSGSGIGVVTAANLIKINGGSIEISSSPIGLSSKISFPKV